ncbi:stage III sporulation protein AG [Pelagirhabdus alkalitolerans]|uniref:Stage III sporulation protein AG n=1 Tax=Pelagirhabdus alkalitolerans TaxID=1612202 RepID=A0A1G6I0L7_9BACI|nr:stage III sporulation protein AG [Pelagirhabdus alkalitolerans]SDC00099.1 stage III sporulation protein AG [Pelagirhabdus alkalitolerans]
MIAIIKSIVKSLTHQEGTDSKKVTMSRLLILGAIGILLILGSHFFSNDQSEDMYPPSVSPNDEVKEDSVDQIRSDDTIHMLENQYNKQLESMIDSIEGVSNTKVMVNLDSTGEEVYEKNLITGTQSTVENDQEGGTRNIEDHTEENQVVIIRQGEKETPLISKSKKPTVRGVLVVSNGVETIEKRQLILDAVSKVLDVGPHRISIMPKDKGEH